MRRRKIIFGILALVACGVLAWLFWPEKPEPVYKGKKLSEWVCKFMTPNEGFTSAIEAVGTNGIPYYLEWIGYEPSLLRRMMNRAVLKTQRRFLFKRFPKDMKQYRAIGSVLALQKLGETAQAAIPRLVSYATNFVPNPGLDYPLMTEPGTMFGLVGTIGGSNTSAFAALMTNQDARIRLLAVQNLGTCRCTTLIPEIRRMLSDQSPEVRVAATNWLENYEGALRPFAERP